MRLIDPVGRDLGAIAVRGVHVPTGAIEDEERRIGEVFQQLNQRPRLCLGVALIDAQPFAAASVLRGEAADIHELRRGRAPIGVGLLKAWGGGERRCEARQGSRAGQSRQKRPAI